MDDKQSVRWYRVPFVWLLVAFPLTAVVAGFVTLGLAIQSDDGVVEDDYYRKGKEINRVLARDVAAARLGLESTLEFNAAQREFALRLRAKPDTKLPQAVEIRFLHATRAGLDRSLIVSRNGDGSYRAPLPELAPGHWNVQLAAHDSRDGGGRARSGTRADDWRLTGSLYVPGEAKLVLRPAGT